MAPSPEYDKEPKAPDKSLQQSGDNNPNDISAAVTETPLNPDVNSGVTAPHTDNEESGQLESLDEGQLKTLLDEAVTYRRPKDREGKSLLFNELLQEVIDSEAEWESQSCRRGGGRGGRGGGAGGGGRRGVARAPLTHSGSLQDLAEGGGAGVGGGAPRPISTRHQRHSRPGRQVSARSQQGGSLPANVDQHNFAEGRRSFLEDVRCGVGGGGGDYIATVRCVNPPPLGERPADYMLLELGGPLGHRNLSPPPPTTRYYTTEDLDMRSPNTPGSRVSVNYTSRATLEIGSPASDTEQPSNPSEFSPGTASLTSAASSCPLQLASSYPSVKSVVGEDPPAAAVTVAGGVPSPIMSQAASATVTTVTSATSLPITTASPATPHFNYIASCNMVPRFAAYQSGKHDNADFKSLDENGNSLQPANTGLTTQSTLGRGSKPKRKKCKNETETLSNEIDGYRGIEDIDDILKFIESDAADNAKQHKANNKSNYSGINGKLSSARDGKSRDDNSHEKGTKKRSTERRMKDGKMDKLKKSNSMEELSRIKLDDLTTGSSKDNLSLRKTKKQSTFDQSDISDSKRSDRRSWGNDGSDSYYSHENNVSNDGDDSFSTNASNSSSTHSSVTGQIVKSKKTKLLPKPPEVESPSLIIEPTLEDFQTVTNKKKIRKRHSPCDETRGRTNNSYGHNNYSGKNGGRFNSGFSIHDRDIIYKRMGGRAGSAERRHPSVSSPPSDKSNDSNDDLDSVHSLPAEASGERLQASYADMARAAVNSLPPRPTPSVSPPPPPPTIVTVQPTPQPQRHHNFPDLIESCNYYSNERPLQDKYLDVSTENTKNLMLKETSAVDATKNKTLKSNIVDAGTQVEPSPPHPIYNHEQYPALEPRSQRDKISSKSKIDSKLCNSVNKNIIPVKNVTLEKRSVVKTNSIKNCQNDDAQNENTMLNDENDSIPDHYVAYVKHSATNSLSQTDDNYRNNDNNNPAKLSFLSGKMDNFISKPPDVVLPLTTDMNQISENRPAVIILNEELKKSDNIHNIDGITFGFDINEQLLNGDIGNDCENNKDVADVDVTSMNNSIGTEVSEPTTMIYNTNEFPPINERPHRENDKPAKGAEEKYGGRRWSKEWGKPRSMSQSEGELGAGEEVQVGHTRALRYLAPCPNPKDTVNLEKLVHYVGMAWEDIIKSPGGKVRYYSEQQ